MKLLQHWGQPLFAAADATGAWAGLLTLRILLAWEFFESGLEKLRGSNWFGDVVDKFPFPFNALPLEISWQMATWCELVGAIALLVGFATRVFGGGLLVVTAIAITSVHWPDSWSTLAELAEGYVLTDRGHGNFKLPVLFLGMLLPLVLLGPGRFSLDALVRQRFLPEPAPSRLA